MLGGKQLLLVRLGLALVLMVLAWGLLFEANPRAAALPQKGGKDKRAEEEDDPPKKEDKPGPKPGKREEEDEGKPPPKSDVTRFDDPEDKEPAKRPSANRGDLKKLAAETKHLLLKPLYAEFAVPYDLVSLKVFSGVKSDGARTGGLYKVRPLATFVNSPRELTEGLALKIIDAAGNDLREERGTAGTIASLRYYEQRAGDEVEDFLKKDLSKHDPAHAHYLSRSAQLDAAETVLAAVLRFHQSARERGARKGDGWESVNKKLREQLLDVQLKQLDQLQGSNLWKAAFDHVRKLSEVYTSTSERKLISQKVPALLEGATRDQLFWEQHKVEVRQQLKALQEAFPDSGVTGPIERSMRNEAERLVAEAMRLRDDKKMAECLEKIKEAEKTWPDLPGLANLRRSVDLSYQRLRVGVRQLPRYLTPGWACTDIEQRCVELLFESLVSLTPDPQGMLYYRPVLAEGRPQVINLGRQFMLPREARWSDGKDLTVNDLRYTVDLLKKGEGTGRGAAWGELLTKVVAEGDRFRVKLRLQQGFLDPLAAMSFKVLPQRSTPDPTSEAFALKPTINSGPYVYRGMKSEASGRAYLAFEANPYYGFRAERGGLPRIREISFYATLDPVKEMRDERIDMAMDLSPEQAEEIQKVSGVEVPSPSTRLPNRRIVFLAVNHRRTTLASPELRVALARAIPRDQLLDSHFRKGLGKKFHRALNGPYPAGSWACNPALVSRLDKESLDPFDLDLAATKFKQALAKMTVREIHLTLKYPSEDPAVGTAMVELCNKLNKSLSGLKLTPMARTAYELRTEVEKEHDYDLAYYTHDFPDETYWLYPLMGPTGRNGGENYLGYTGSLVGQIQGVASRRNFAQVREYAHTIHRQLLESEMPIVPLWQLDPLWAYRKDKMQDIPTLVDPVTLFTRIEEWQVIGTRP